MRRDYFTLSATGVAPEDSDRPTIRIAYAGPLEELTSRLRAGDTQLDEGNIDVTYRLRDGLEADTPMGVFAISDRVTGEYILELNVEADSIFAVTDAAADGDENETSGRYRLIIEADGTRLASYDKSTLLVYDGDGELLRDRSLIPSGVEI